MKKKREAAGDGTGPDDSEDGGRGEYRNVVKCGAAGVKIFKSVKCSKCGSTVRIEYKRPRYRKRTVAIAVVSIILGSYFLKNIYEATFKRKVIMNLVEALLDSKIISGLNISDSTRENIKTFAEYISTDGERENKEKIPGEVLYDLGVREKHPIVIIPGIANTNLELWKGSKGTKSFFRKRIWGSSSMFTFMIQNRSEWFESMKLNEETGLDPPNVKVRPFFGLDSSDFDIPGMWIWWKIIENLSELGYDNTGMHFASFDWRLGFEEMERRDSYFTKLKSDIEHLKAVKGEKVVLIAHSLGALVGYYFLKWAESQHGGRGGPKWVDQHIKSVINIGGPMLGVPKAISGLVSGEGKDTAQLGTIESALLEILFGREQRKELFKTWTSALMLLPKGGRAFWERTGDETADGCRQKTILEIGTGEKGAPSRPIELEHLTEFLIPFLSKYNQEVIRARNTTTYARTPRDLRDDPVGWSNPLESALPDAPSLTIYSFYGVSKATERAYRYRERGKLRINVSGGSSDGSLERGVYTTDGDGTVPILSSGYMGYKAWRMPLHNPHGVKSVVREYVHTPNPSVIQLRGGSSSAEHVNILGNHELTNDILYVVSGYKEVEGRVTSALPDVCERVEASKQAVEHPDGTRVLAAGQVHGPAGAPVAIP